ncbi:MAG TPA: ribosome maturation factor RimM [Firmicutes bacterium]|nr:ribosome maturation factor RimM [Bacillota bacterium]
MEFLQVGKIVNTHALQGEVKIVASSDFTEERFAKGSQLYIEFEGQHVPVVVATHRAHKGADLVKFKQLNSINDVEKYKGCSLLVSMDDISDLDEHEFYYFEIIGCQVVTTEGKEVGEVSEILTTGANDVWVVKRQGQKEALIPYIEHIVKSVDVDQKLITIEEVEGLL